MGEALVQHAQDDVDDDDRHQQDQAEALQRVLERLRRALELRVMVAGSVAAAAVWICVTASPSAKPGSRLNETITDGSWPK